MIIVPASLIILAMIGLRKLFPYRPVDTYWQPGHEAFEKYKRWDKISGWLMLLYIAIAMLIICGPLAYFRNFSQSQDTAAQFLILPDLFDWVMIAWIPIFGLSPFIILFLGGRLYLRDDFSGYFDYANRKSKYNAVGALVPLFGGLTMLGITLFYFLWNYGIYAYRDKIVAHWFLSTKAQVYSYDQIKSISFTPGTTEKAARADITFKDGMDWDTSNGLRDPNVAKHVQFISKQSGVKIDTVYKTNN
ncbi:MAG: hypothetical protein JO080_00510 [Mucilaginibacter sp.]|nr:hypothetical protein [Mucilaginibacter sp.]